MLTTVPDIIACDSEPIHIPGSIQPHGVMLVADLMKLTVSHTAGDVSRILGVPAGANRKLADFIGPALSERAKAIAVSSQKRAFIGVVETRGIEVDITAHVSGGYLVVELEPKAEASKSSAELLGALESASAAFDQAVSLQSVCEVAAVEFRRLTRYDRVMIYQFLDEGAGCVLAEDRRPGLQSFLNHHFPGSDIPRQARTLYIRNLLRVIPDVSYAPAPLQPNWEGTAQLDMSDSILRSVSPIHLQYLKNMGVAASASISVVKDGILWGLIACHHETPLKIPYDVRAACRTLASTLSRQIKSWEEIEVYRERLRLRGSEDETTSLLSRHGSLEEEVTHHLDELSGLFSGDGFAVMRGEELFSRGACPSETDLRRLAGWLLGKSVGTVFSTDRLPALYPEAKQFQNVSAGVLAILLSAEERWMLIWFRAEQAQVVKWAGNPHKDADLKPGETLRPRASFEAWQESVHGRSRRWTLAELEAAGRIRQKLIEIKQNRRLKELNGQLTQNLAEKNVLLDQKEFLIGEINHRVQNSLQLVSSFLSLQARESDDEAFVNAVEEARRRIKAVSLLHSSLYRGEALGVTDLGRYIAELCENLIASMGKEWGTFFSLRLDPVMLPINRVIPLGLVVTELVININKYAYGGAPGPVEIILTEDRTRFRLVVSDKGRGRVSTRPGFGTRMLNALVSQLSGELVFEDNAPGLLVNFSAAIVP